MTIENTFIELCYRLQNDIAKMAENIEKTDGYWDSSRVYDHTLTNQETGQKEGRKWRYIGGKWLSSVAVNVTSRPLKSPLEPNSTLVGGISTILHGEQPHIPSIHMNLRMFTDTEKGLLISGVQDLNPMIDHDEDTKLFHQGLKAICDGYSPQCYELLSQHCDRYFYNHYVSRPRGVGGIFYEDMNSGDNKKDLTFTQAIGEHFTSFYSACVEKHKHSAAKDHDVTTQQTMRAYYGLYNMLIDRGTVWGIMNPNVDPLHVFASLAPTFTWPEHVMEIIKENIGTDDGDIIALIEKLVEATRVFEPESGASDSDKNDAILAFSGYIRSYYQQHPEKLPHKDDVTPGALAKEQASGQEAVATALKAFPGYVPSKLLSNAA